MYLQENKVITSLPQQQICTTPTEKLKQIMRIMTKYLDPAVSVPKKNHCHTGPEVVQSIDKQNLMT